ncbi:MAG: DUF2752 domain-containing protein [Planctomycetota bacterium]
MNRLRRVLEFFVSTEKSLPADPQTHKTYLVIALALVTLPFFLSCPAPGKEGLAFLGLHLPGVCPSQRLFGVTCPGCGLTRAFVLIAHGHFRDSLEFNRMGVPLYLFFACQVVFRACVLRRPQTARVPFLINVNHYSALAMIALLLLNWFASLLS